MALWPASAVSLPVSAGPLAGSSGNCSTVTVGTGCSWGYNFYGQLGNNTTTNSSNPVQVVGPGGSGSLSGIVAIAAGAYHSLALKADGTVWSWGDNEQGELGDGTTTSRAAPVQVVGPGGLGTLSGIVAIAAGLGFSLAVKSDGTVMSWGKNTEGELGAPSSNTCLSTQPCSTTPIQVTGLVGVSTIAAGEYHALAVKRDGSVWGWGYNAFGEVGDGTTIQRNTPVQVIGPGGSGSLGGITSVSAGGSFSTARKSDSTVWSWGVNLNGQLGDGTTTNRSTPVQVIGPGRVGFLGSITSTSSGGQHVLALKNDGTIWSWGENSNGALGGTSSDMCPTNPPSACSVSPIQVLTPKGSGFFSGAVAVAAGGVNVGGWDSSLALKSDGTVWAWGLNQYGQLGDGTTTSRSRPVQSGALTGMTILAAGGQDSLAAVTVPTQAAPVGTTQIRTSYHASSPDPVDTLAGAYTYSHTDLAIPGRGPSPAFVRSFNSNDTRVGPLGPGWTHNYAAHLSLSGDGAGTLILETAGGCSDTYTTSGGGVYTSPVAVYTTLVRNNDGSFTATNLDQSSMSFNGAGQLIKVTDRYGNSSTLSYNSSGQLTSVSDPAGRGSLTFSYTAALLTSVTDWASPARSVTFGYDASNRLHTVTDRTGKITAFGYDGTSSRLTTITDANSHTAVTMTYDGSQRVAT
jgi:YD repeat-containing protein